MSAPAAVLLSLLMPPGPAGSGEPAALALAPGRTLAARVLAAGDGRVELAIAGGRMSAATHLALEPGQTVRLTVADADAGRVVLRAEPPAGPAPATAAAPAADPAAAGAWLQVPLPGGAAAEVRVAPDGGGPPGSDGARRPRRIAVLLHLPALGAIAIDALAGPDGVDASVRAGGEEARAFLAARAPELVRSLARAGLPASVGVRAMEGPPPERLAPPAPFRGLDASA